MARPLNVAHTAAVIAVQHYASSDVMKSSKSMAGVNNQNCSSCSSGRLGVRLSKRQVTSTAEGRKATVSVMAVHDLLIRIVSSSFFFAGHLLQRKFHC
jgi:hypothetical protein